MNDARMGIGRKSLPAALVVLLLPFTAGLPARAGDGAAKTTLVSKATSGEPANAGSLDPSVSRDGRFVAFTSWAENLPGGDATQPQIYVRDRVARTTRLVSKNPAGKPAGKGAFLPEISANGRYVAFRSASNNMPGGNGFHDLIYLRDLVEGTTLLVSKNSQGEPVDRSADNPSISGNGRFVAFQSDAFNVPGEDWTRKILIHDTETGKTTLASKTSDGQPVKCCSALPSVSGDGRYVAFQSNASNLPGCLEGYTCVYVRDRSAKSTRLVSVTSEGETVNDFAAFPVISANGAHVLFGSRATNLPGGDGERHQLYVHTLTTGTTTLVSRTSSGDAANGDSFDHAISGSGRFISFASTASNLSSGWPNQQVYLHDRADGSTTLVSKDALGEPAAGLNELTAISRDARYVAFDSTAGNLPGGGGTHRVFIHGPL